MKERRINLEDRLAYWIDLGFLPYTEAYDIQRRAYELRRKDRIPDTIFIAEHPIEVNFGADESDNKFSDNFSGEVKQIHGNCEHNNIVRRLEEKGIKFSKTKRGGGATVLAPGQVVFYAVVNHEDITGKRYIPQRGDDLGEIPVVPYKKVIDQVLGGVMNRFNILNVEISNGIGRDQLDVWITKNGKPFKLGSKGLSMGSRFAYHGFVVYAHKEGVEPFKFINPCGFSPDKVGVTSIEEVIGFKVSKDEVKQLTKEEITKQFRYSKIVDLSYEDFLKL